MSSLFISSPPVCHNSRHQISSNCTSLVQISRKLRGKKRENDHHRLHPYNTLPWQPSAIFAIIMASISQPPHAAQLIMSPSPCFVFNALCNIL